ncbi:asparaginase [Paracoccus aerodenitrificans]|uniref:asparaginase n=1 Tax=Paracoccus aerodenitrificans TaxID=3017781 RepID=UPI0022F0652F|nr:asparaginase [Paracoccus aerodenitrificans]WBU63612.1 asparaginase [Paracoccus aerodenitrificans]
MPAAELIEIWRGGLREGVHRGHAVIHDGRGIVEAWGDPSAIIFPRSSCKIIQALPLVESGAADAAGLGAEQLALSCASHSGAALHVGKVRSWLEGMGLSETDLRCGCHMPWNKDENRLLTCGDHAPSQLHNNCSGKHAGFLSWVRHEKAGPEYVELDHPLQQAIRSVTAEVTGEEPAGVGIDGCSAPNFAGSITGLARAMAAFAQPKEDTRGQAMSRLVQAMCTYPELVADEGRACTELMRAMGGRVAVKTGAEAVFIAIIPDRKLGVAVKIEDGGTRASEAAITALLVHLGVLDKAHPVVGKLLTGPMVNWRSIEVGGLRLASGFPV